MYKPEIHREGIMFGSDSAVIVYLKHISTEQSSAAWKKRTWDMA